jgi:hypothetical protein
MTRRTIPLGMIVNIHHARPLSRRRPRRPLLDSGHEAQTCREVNNRGDHLPLGPPAGSRSGRPPLPYRPCTRRMAQITRRTDCRVKIPRSGEQEQPRARSKLAVHHQQYPPPSSSPQRHASRQGGRSTREAAVVVAAAAAAAILPLHLVHDLPARRWLTSILRGQAAEALERVATKGT